MKRYVTGLFALGLSFAVGNESRAADVAVAPQTATINKHLSEGWTKAGIKKPAEKATDLEFMRRVFIDLIGRIPSYEEAVDFDQDKGANKRARLVNRLLYAKDYKPKKNGTTIKLDERFTVLPLDLRLLPGAPSSIPALPVLSVARVLNAPFIPPPAQGANAAYSAPVIGNLYWQTQSLPSVPTVMFDVPLIAGDIVTIAI